MVEIILKNGVKLVLRTKNGGTVEFYKGIPQYLSENNEIFKKIDGMEPHRKSEMFDINSGIKALNLPPGWKTLPPATQKNIIETLGLSVKKKSPALVDYIKVIEGAISKGIAVEKETTKKPGQVNMKVLLEANSTLEKKVEELSKKITNSEKAFEKTISDLLAKHEAELKVAVTKKT